MNGFYAFDVKDNLLSSTVWLTCTVQTEFTLSGVKPEKTMCRKRLFLVRGQPDNIPIECDNSPHVFDKEYDTSYIHAIAPNHVMQVATLVPLLQIALNPNPIGAKVHRSYPLKNAPTF